MMRLEARGSLLMRKAAANALQLSQLDAGDAAALAWKVHTGGAAAAEEVVRLLLQQVGGADAVQRSVVCARPRTCILCWPQESEVLVAQQGPNCSDC
jgi:hypothetical protein